MRMNRGHAKDTSSFDFDLSASKINLDLSQVVDDTDEIGIENQTNIPLLVQAAASFYVRYRKILQKQIPSLHAVSSVPVTQVFSTQTNDDKTLVSTSQSQSIPYDTLF